VATTLGAIPQCAGPGGFNAHFSRTVLDEFAETTWKERTTLPGQATYPKPFKPMTDKFSAQSYPETTPMNSTSQTAQEQRPANLAVLHQTLKEMFVRTKSAIPTTRARPVSVQRPVIVIRGK